MVHRTFRARLMQAFIAFAVLAGCLGTVLGVVAPAASAQTGLRYVALGDSYSAGPLDGPITGNPLCLQSSASYPFYTASYLGATLDDVSCSGADSSDLTTASQYPGVTPQVDALSPATQLVSLTDGGNDNNLFVSAVAECSVTDIADFLNIGTPCKDVYGNTFSNDISADAATVEQTFAAVKADAPNAQIYVLGYPDILPSSGNCYPTMPLTSGDTAYLNQVELQLDSTVQSAAAKAGVHYVSTYSQFIGHGACATGSKQWINPILPTSGGISVHPNASGEQELAAILDTRLAQDGI